MSITTTVIAKEAREFVEKHEKYEQEQESARAFKETWGISKEEMYKKILLRSGQVIKLNKL